MSDRSAPEPGATSEQLTNEGGTPTGGSRRRGLLVGGAVAVVAVAGGAAWAATSFLGQGSQPAEALPSATLGYASIDLDPGGSQKVEALQVLRKFPAIEEELDLGTGDDLREELFTSVMSSGSCEEVDFAADVEPWLGSRAAVAAVDVDGRATPVVVFQHTDAGAAQEGVNVIAEACSMQPSAFDVRDEWVVMAESAEQLAGVTAPLDEGTLADGEDFQRWTDEVGDPGIVSLYAAPEVGTFLAEHPSGYFGSSGTAGSEGDVTEVPTEMPPEVEAALEEFEGGAATIRFSDGALELESALGAGDQTELMTGVAGGGSLVSTLPDDTAVALGFGLPEDWTDAMLDRMASSSGGEMSAEQLAQQLEAMLGITPDDLETLLGEAVAVALGPDFSMASMMSSSGPESLPVGVKVRGDASAIEDVLGEVRAGMGPMGAMLESETRDGVVTVSPNADYRSELASGGSLGDSAVFEEVLEDGADASGVLFVNFDAGDGGWLEGLAAGDPKIEENLAPLSALGASSRVDDGTARFVVRLTTE
jgi:hypothetical protein